MHLSKYFFLLILIFFIGTANAESAYRQLQLNNGFGQQSNSGTDQDNRLIGLDYFFKRYSLTPNQRLEWAMGVGYTKLTADQGSNRTVNVISFIHQLRYYFLSDTFSRRKTGLLPFVEVSIAPSLMDETVLGFTEQGGHFIFSDTIGIGTHFGPHNEWTIQLQWRHLSNGGLKDPNPGFDIPLNVSYSWTF